MGKAQFGFPPVVHGQLVCWAPALLELTAHSRGPSRPGGLLARHFLWWDSCLPLLVLLQKLLLQPFHLVSQPHYQPQEFQKWLLHNSCTSSLCSTSLSLPPPLRCGSKPAAPFHLRRFLQSGEHAEAELDSEPTHLQGRQRERLRK